MPPPFDRAARRRPAPFLPSSALGLLLALLGAVPLGAQQGSFVPCTRVLHTFTGEAAGDQFGWVSAPLADLDGDGLPELVVGAPFHAQSGANRGRIYVYSGGSGVELFHADGGVAQERLGHAVRPAGDLDGDGIEDVLASGPGSAGVAGAARVFSGATGALLLTIGLGVPGDSFGFSCAGLGDVDGDGVPDLAVSAPTDGTAGASAGRVVVVSGADGTTVLHTFLGSAPGDLFGSAVARLADMTGDGLPQLVVGASGAGSGGLAYVFDLASEALLYPPLVPNASAVSFGQFFADEIGEVDGDGLPDLYVGDFADGGGRGRAYVFSGATGARLLTLTGPSGAGFGIGRGLGDVNGDGRADLVLGSWTASQGATRAGRLEVYSGADGTLLRRVTSTTPREALGFDAHGLGDLDGDGQPELVGTAASFGQSRGRVYVIASRPLEPFGQGLAGSGGITPRLSLGGCPVLGSMATLETADVLGGAPGLWLIGTERVEIPLLRGVLYAGSGAWSLAHVAGGTPGQPGTGTASHAFTLPIAPSLIGRRYVAQAFYADPGAPRGVSFTAGLEITLY